MCEELRTDRSLPKFAQAITLYHLIIEASMAQPGQHYIEDYFTKAGTMPAFSEGMHNVARDEQRHIGFGVKVLSELLDESEECKAAVVEILREMLPYLTSVFIPPNWDERVHPLLRLHAGGDLRLRHALGGDEVEGDRLPVRRDAARRLPLRPRDAPRGARRAADQAARRPACWASPTGPPGSSPEVQEIYFDIVARSAETDAVDRPVTFQWKFADAEDWHIRIDNGSTAAVRGLAEKPT